MSMWRKSILILLLSYLGRLQGGEVIDSVTVTASRLAIPVSEVAGALTIIDKEQIGKRNAVYVADLLQGVPGLNVNRQGGAGSLTQVRLRGAEANQVLVLIDGIEVNDPASGSEFNFAHLPIAGIEQIEVLRGPQSSLWGSDALAGVINIVTSQGKHGRQIIARSSYGSENSYEGGVNILAGTDTFDLALSGNFIDTHGINIATTGNERDGYDNATINLNTNYQLLDNLALSMVGRYTNANNEFDPAPIGLPIDGRGDIDVEQIYGRIFARLHLFNDRWMHQLEAAITDTSNANQDELFGKSKTEGAKEKFAYQTALHLPQSNTLATQQSVILVLEREQERFKQSGASFPGFDPNQRQKITTNSKIIEYRLRLIEHMSLTAAFRHDENNEFDNQNTYRVGVSHFYPKTNTKIYVTHGTGAKNPTFTEIFGFAPNNFIGNPDLEPEQSESWEVGFVQNLFDSKLQIDVALFNEDLIDEIQTVFLPTFQTTVVNNNSRSDRNGFEISANSEINDAVSLTASYTYLDASEPDVSGEKRTEIRRPKNQWAGQLNYSFLDHKANLNVSIDYVGKRRDIDFSTGNRETLDDYARVDVGLNYQVRESIKMFIQLKNILDEEYQDVFGFESDDFSGFAGIEISL